MIKAIIFDCFGVLVQGSLENFIDLYFSHDESLVERAHEINQQCSKGFVTYEEQISAYAKMAGISIEETEKLMNHNPRNEKLLTHIKSELKPHYKIGFLSNAGANWMDELFTEEDQALFDSVVLSFEHNMAKPDRELYEIACRELDITPEEAVFIDDVDAYCKGAEHVGMQAIVYKNFAQFSDNLRTILTS